MTDWAAVATEIGEHGGALLPRLLTPRRGRRCP